MENCSIRVCSIGFGFNLLREMPEELLVVLCSHYQLLNQDRIPEETDSMRGSYLGPAFGEETIREFLDEEKAPYHFYENEDELLNFTAQKIADENIIGWFDGRMEFGPRALGQPQHSR